MIRRGVFPLLLVLALAACGGDGSSTAPSPTPSPSPVVVLPSPTAEPTPTPTPEPAVQRMAYIGTDGNVWIINADGSGNQKVFDAMADSLFSLSWSPDGSKFAVTGRDDEVYIVAANGDLLQQGPADQFLAWSPTGDMFAVARFAPLAQENSVVVLDSRGDAVIELSGASGASFSADGARLAFFLTAGHEFLYPDVRGMLADLESGRVSPIDPDEEPSGEIFSKGSPIFSPSNPSLLAYSDRLIELDTTEEGSLPGSATRWSPDGQLLLVACGSRFGGQVYEVETAASILEFNVNAIGTDAPCPGIIDRLTAWSIDSRLLSFYEVGLEPDYEPALLHIQEVATSDDKTISMRFPASLEFSPDSSQLLFSNPDGIWLVDADGANLTLLAEGTSPAWQPQP